MQQIILENNSIQSLNEYKKNKNELMNVLNKKLKAEDNQELITYLTQVKELENQRINYIALIEKKHSYNKNTKDIVNKISDIFSRRLRLEIDNINDKSLEVSINILNSTIGSINEQLKKIITASKIGYETIDSTRESINIKIKNFSITLPDKEIGDRHEYKYK